MSSRSASFRGTLALRPLFVVGACIVLSSALPGCGSNPDAPTDIELQSTQPVMPAVPPQHVQVQEVLIGFAGSIPGRNIARSRSEALELAHQLLHKARTGYSFDSLVELYSDDQFPGIYAMSNKGIPPTRGEYPRGGMVQAFGDVSFSISVGNIGMAEYDARVSPYGWHIIKRLK